MTSPPVLLSSEEVLAHLDYDGCIGVLREAMLSLSEDPREQPLRQIAQLGEGRIFGLMPGLFPLDQDFGAKLVSVFPDPGRPGRSAHRGIVALFDGASGEPVCVADAETVTFVRTGCASAVATDALARKDARSLAIFGCGAQARSHLSALTRVRKIERIGIWGRDIESACQFAGEASNEVSAEVRAWDDPAKLAAESDIICTVTSARDPILKGEWVRPGTHVNAVGSSFAGPREIDSALVAASRYFVDYRRSALAAAAEFLAARDEGLIGEEHILGEIGAVLGGKAEGRRSSEDITLYKSLGHIAQDLAAVRYALSRFRSRRSS